MAPEAAESSPLLQNDAKRHIGALSATFLLLNKMIGTGIFSVPALVYASTGSIGWSLVLWLAGGFIMICGFSVYLEYGLKLPHSGGELNYLGWVYRYPKHLIPVVFAFTWFFLSYSSSNAYALGLYIQLVFGKEPSDDMSRYIASATVVAICALHNFWPSIGKGAYNVFGFAKLFVLCFIVLFGCLVIAGVKEVPDGRKFDNFRDMFANDGFGGGIYGFSVALLRISYSFRGWETANMVMGEVKRPYRTMIRAGPYAMFATITLYFLCNLAYFIVIPKEEVADSGVVIAGIFFIKLFEKSVASRLLPFFICLSNFGNILVVSYSCASMVREFGKMYLLPFPALLAHTSATGSPTTGLALHAIISVSMLLLLPAGSVYEFVVDLSTYPVALFAAAISVGLLYLHFESGEERSSYRHSNLWTSPTAAIVIFCVANLAILILPWVPPDNPPKALPYYASSLGSLLVSLAGCLYYLWWRRTDNPSNLEAFCSERENIYI